jgi:hypothetical protein
MPPLTWRVDTWPGSAHLALQGRPDPASMTRLQEVLEGLFDRRNGSVVIDFSAVQQPDRKTLIGSTLIGGYARMNCGPAVLLCRGRRLEAVTASVDSRGLHARMSRDLTDAWQAITRGPLRSPSFTEQLLPLPGAARHSRDVVTAACLHWDLPHLVGAASLVASELVSHTLDHVSTTMSVTVLLDHDVLYLWVRSGSWSEPTPRHAGTSLDLLVINSFATHWGFLPDGDDTLSWAALPTDPAGR